MKGIFFGPSVEYVILQKKANVGATLEAKAKAKSQAKSEAKVGTMAEGKAEAEVEPPKILSTAL